MASAAWTSAPSTVNAPLRAGTHGRGRTSTLCPGTVKVRAADGSGRGSGVPQFWADRVMLFSDCSRFLNALVVVVPERDLDEVMLLKIKERLEEHPGNSLVYLRLLQTDGSFREMKLREQRVALDNELLVSLREVSGPDSIRFKGEMPSFARNGDRFRKGAYNKARKPDGQ